MSARLWEIGRDLQSRVKTYFDEPPGPDAAPLELLHATLDELERRIQPAGRGRRLFPYNRVVVRIAQPGADPIAIEAVFRDLSAKLIERLQELRCEAPASITSSVSFEDPSEARPILTVEPLSESELMPAPVPPGPRPSLALSVVKGQCAAPEYAFDRADIAIGRTAEPIDAFGQVRVNDIAFLDVRDGVNETVARAHARLRFDPQSCQYLLFNESRSNPTCVLRAGKTIRVPPRNPRGVRVQAQDLLQFGRALLRVL